MKSEPVPRVPRRRRPKKRQRHSDTDSGGRPKPATYGQSSHHYNQRALKQRTLLTDRTHERTLSHINAEKTKFSRRMNRKETDLLNRLMELEAVLPKIESNTGTTDIGKPEKVDKSRKNLPHGEKVVPKETIESSSTEKPVDERQTLSSQLNGTRSLTATELGKEVKNTAASGRLSAVKEESEEGSTVSLPLIAPNSSQNCVVCEGKEKQSDAELGAVAKDIKDSTDEGVRLPEIDKLSDEEKAEAALNPGLPRSLIREKIRKRSTSKPPTSTSTSHVHFSKTEKNENGDYSNGQKTKDGVHPLERDVQHLPPVQPDRDYGRRTWPGDSIELTGMNGYTSDIMPKVIQASYNTRLYDRTEQGSNRLPVVTRSNALIRRTQSKPSRDMYVWLGLDSQYQLRLMTNPKSASHTDKS